MLSWPDSDSSLRRRGFRQGALAFQQRRMGIIEAAIQRVWREVAEVLLVQFAQRAYQRTRLAHHRRRKRVGLVFVSARPRMGQRREPERGDTGQKSEQEQCGRQAARWEPEGAVKPILPCQQRDQVKAGEGSEGRKQ